MLTSISAGVGDLPCFATFFYFCIPRKSDLKPVSACALAQMLEN